MGAIKSRPLSTKSAGGRPVSLKGIEDEKYENSKSLRKTKVKEKVVKLVLYGTGEAGKTTILRQLILSHGGKIEEVNQYKGKILLNLLEGACAVLDCGESKYGIKFDSPEAELIRNEYKKVTSSEKKNIDLTYYFFQKLTAKCLISLCDDPEFNKVLYSDMLYTIPFGWVYFAEKLKTQPGYPDWGGKDWFPNEEDLLRSRIRTTGKKSFTFEQDDVKYEVIDTGGQKSERRKWKTLVAGCDAMLFVASLSEYDQVLYEDQVTNRLTETVNLWERMVNDREMKNTWFILFLNKTDVLKEKFKIKNIPVEPEIPVHAPPPLPEQDDENCTKIKEWFEDLFMSKASASKQRQVRVYFTNAMDREDVKTQIAFTSALLKQNFAVMDTSMFK